MHVVDGNVDDDGRWVREEWAAWWWVYGVSKGQYLST
jgi:hypothetical protein